MTIEKTTKMPAPAERLPIRQGDVALIPVDALPPGAVLVPHGTGPVVVAFGAATGHAHQVEGGSTLHEADGQRFVVLPRPGALVHTATNPVEHETIPLSAGTLLVRRQFTASDVGARPVED